MASSFFVFGSELSFGRRQYKGMIPVCQRGIMKQRDMECEGENMRGGVAGYANLP
jgi:hypothetical protein